jgi:hypothetical protein
MGGGRSPSKRNGSAVAALLLKHQVNEFTGEPVVGITVNFVKPEPIPPENTG